MDKEYRDVTFGADPELFAIRSDTGEYRSVHGIINGTKRSPHSVDGGAVQVDGTAAEFNIDPVTNEDDWVSNIAKVRDYLTKELSQHGLVTAATPVATYSLKYYNELPEYTKEMGCDPDFNAWEHGSVNECPVPVECLAAGGGHIHVGFNLDGLEMGDPMHEHLSHQLVKQLDAVVGLAAFSWDTDGRRRKMYGKAGAYRLKPYGVEYRTLSNAWVRTPELQRKVFRLVQFAISRLNRGVAYEHILGDLPRQLINNNEGDRALRVSRNILRGEFDNAIPLTG